MKRQFQKVESVYPLAVCHPSLSTKNAAQEFHEFGPLSGIKPVRAGGGSFPAFEGGEAQAQGV